MNVCLCQLQFEGYRGRYSLQLTQTAARFFEAGPPSKPGTGNFQSPATFLLFSNVNGTARTVYISYTPQDFSFFLSSAGALLAVAMDRLARGKRQF